MSIYVNNGDGERELREIETPRGVVTSVSVNHGDGDGEQTVWSSLSQMALQFDARQLALDDGDRVAEWDTTDGDLTAAQSSTDNQPTYVSDGVGGNPSVQFDGEQYLEAGYFDEDDVLEQPYTWAAVLQHDPTSEYDYVFYGADTDERSFLELTPENTTRLWAGEPGGIETETQGQIIIGVVDGNNSVLKVVNPVTSKSEEISGDAGNLAHSGLTIGSHSDGSRGFQGLMAELRLYNYRLMSKERDALIGHLKSIWEPNHAPEREVVDSTININYNQYDDPDDVYWRSFENGSWSKGGIHFINRNGKRVMKNPLDFTSSSQGAVGYDFTQDDIVGTDASEVYQSIDIQLSEDYQLSNLGTHRLVHAGRSWAGSGHSGGSSPDGTDGWSIAPYIAARDRGESRPTNHYPISLYIYHMDEAADSIHAHTNPSGFPNGPQYLVSGMTHTMETYINMNTTSGGTANNDAIIKIWLDDTLVFESVDDYRFDVLGKGGGNQIHTVGTMGYIIGDGNGDVFYSNHQISVEDDIPNEIRIEPDRWS
ncbi:hypothetical protein ACLI4U_15055 [Natrialbaceae archaeon A-CW2]